MTTGMLQDTIQTSPSGSGPRFRPYACPNHHVTKGRYITSNDSRGYIPVYEYPLNGQWIMMDIDDGYILWTGIWKALGNSKADIVKMIDSQPDLAPLIRRVRGGYLKIQGTWMPYEVALKLSRRVAWMIRDDLIPLFGPTFPSTCLSPDQPGYGQVVPTGQNRRRTRRTARNSIVEIPRAPNGWTVVTPSFHPANVRSSADYHMASPYPVPSQLNGSTLSPSDIRLSPIQNTKSADSHRYGGYNNNTQHPPPLPPPSYRNPAAPPPPPSGKTGLSLDVGSRDGGPPQSRLKEGFSLPPIQAPDCNNSGPSPYSLPPISSMEDPRGIAPQDSAAVLRRLRLDDDGYTTACRPSEDRTTWGGRRQSLSTQSSSSRSLEASPRFQPYNSSSRSYQDHHSVNNRGHSPASTTHSYHRTQRNNNSGGRYPPVQSDASQYSHEGDSTSNPSPTSPTTPNSSLSENDNNSNNHLLLPHLGGKLSVSSQGKQYLPDRSHHHQWSSTTITTTTTSHLDNNNNRHGRMIMENRPEIISIRRNSYEASSDGDPNQPHRPW
ncbi:hypothetical protein BYT27DRAFT_7201955 [Phlegmacium glaucopus]|nr:hypothetical protein BYT27DRAFT_7201955 [Phlegmacium glaucopus]